MAPDIVRAGVIKELLERASLGGMISYAQMASPNECCGFILESGAIHPAQNVVHKLRNSTLTSKNAFLIDEDSWKIASRRESPIMGIYHSHTNGDAQMSTADTTFLRWAELIYVVVALNDGQYVASNLFWWEGNELKQLPLEDRKTNEDPKR